MDTVKHSSSEYEELLDIQGMKNLVFHLNKIIDEPNQLDVWVVYKTERDIDQYHNLHSCLFQIHLDSENVTKTYTI